MSGSDRVDRRQVSNIPILPAYEAFVNESTYWLVWCDHCETWHRHGPMNGRREAHCSDKISPYWNSGYYIEYAGWADRNFPPPNM